MDTPICRMLGVGFPLLAFSHCRDVVAAVSNAGGFGVFGAAGYTPEQLETELGWIDGHVGGRPYGVDLLVPENLAVRTAAGATRGDRGGGGVDRLGLAGDARGGDVAGVSCEDGGGAVARHRSLPRAHRQAGTAAWFGVDRCVGGGGQSGSVADAVARSDPAMARVNRAAEACGEQARALVSYFVGQGVGLADGIAECRQVVAGFMTEFAEALEDMQRLSAAL